MPFSRRWQSSQNGVRWGSTAVSMPSKIAVLRQYIPAISRKRARTTSVTSPYESSSNCGRIKQALQIRGASRHLNLREAPDRIGKPLHQPDEKSRLGVRPGAAPAPSFSRVRLLVRR